MQAQIVAVYIGHFHLPAKCGMERMKINFKNANVRAYM